MSGSRESDSDMGHSSKPTLDVAWAEVRRVRKDKSDKLWVAGELKEDRQKFKNLKEKVETLEKALTEIQKDDRDVANQASKAQRLAEEAKADLAKGHRCLHENTLMNLDSSVAETAVMMKSITSMRRRSYYGQGIAFLLLVITIGGTVIAWRTDAEVGKNERVELKANDIKQEASLKRIEGKLDRRSIDDIDGMTAAFKQALTDHDKEKTEEESKPNPRGRRRAQ